MDTQNPFYGDKPFTVTHGGFCFLIDPQSPLALFLKNKALELGGWDRLEEEMRRELKEWGL